MSSTDEAGFPLPDTDAIVAAAKRRQQIRARLDQINANRKVALENANKLLTACERALPSPTDYDKDSVIPPERRPAVADALRALWTGLREERIDVGRLIDQIENHARFVGGDNFGYFVHLTQRGRDGDQDGIIHLLADLDKLPSRPDPDMPGEVSQEGVWRAFTATLRELLSQFKVSPFLPDGEEGARLSQELKQPAPATLPAEAATQKGALTTESTPVDRTDSMEDAIVASRSAESTQRRTNSLGFTVPPCPSCGSPPAADDVDDECPRCGAYFFHSGIAVHHSLPQGPDAPQTPDPVQQMAKPCWERLPPSQVRSKTSPQQAALQDTAKTFPLKPAANNMDDHYHAVEFRKLLDRWLPLRVSQQVRLQVLAGTEWEDGTTEQAHALLDGLERHGYAAARFVARHTGASDSELVLWWVQSQLADDLRLDNESAAQFYAVRLKMDNAILQAEVANVPAADEKPHPTVGILTARNHEFVAVKMMLDCPRNYDVPSHDVRYIVGEIPGSDRKPHQVVLALGDMYESLAAAHGAEMIIHFPTLKRVLMVGIAGGVPNPPFVDEHVRLGDLVVSDNYGVVQYDSVKQKNPHDVEVRSAPRPPSSRLLHYFRHLLAGMMEGHFPWEEHIRRGLDKLGWGRPADVTDFLGATADHRQQIVHPDDPKRRRGQPRVFSGLIASSNTLLKDAAKRDALRDGIKAKAIEMETAGLADAAWLREKSYFAVRGICDYCDLNKNDDWQPYAAMAAAALVRALLESMPAG